MTVQEHIESQTPTGAKAKKVDLEAMEKDRVLEQVLR